MYRPSVNSIVDGSVTVHVRKWSTISGRSVVTPIERQELDLGTVQPGGHLNFGIAHRKVRQSPAGEVQQRLRRLTFGAWVTVKLVVVDGVLDALREVRRQFDRGDRQSVEEQHQIDAVLVALRVSHLPDDSQPIRHIPACSSGFMARAGLN